MGYTFNDTPIIKSRIDRSSYRKESPWQRQRRFLEQQKKEELVAETSVEELIKQGYYNSKDSIIEPFGVEVFLRKSTTQDIEGEWYEKLTPTLALALPKLEKLSYLEKLSPYYWENSKTHYWKFELYSDAAIIWCCLDLLNRLLDLPMLADKH